MRDAKLTSAACPAHKVPMQGPCAKVMRGAMLAMGAMALGGCITVNAPSEPIVIELNINITQEVIYRLAEDAGQAIEANADIF